MQLQYNKNPQVENFKMRCVYNVPSTHDDVVIYLVIHFVLK